MDQEKRVLIAFALSFALLMLWRALFVKEQPPARTPSGPQAAKASAPHQTSALPEAAKQKGPIPLPVEQGSQGKEIVVENDFYRVTLSSQGAVVKGWVLKKYHDAEEKPLDVVDRAACATLGFPLKLGLADRPLADQLNAAIFVVKPLGETLRAPVKVEFVYSDGKIRATKAFSFGSGYEVGVEVGIFDGERYLPLEIAWPGGFGDYSLPIKVRETQSWAVYGTTEKLTTLAVGKVKEDHTIPGPLQVAGLADRFFVDIFLPESPDVNFRVGRRAWNPPEWKEKEPPMPLEAVLADPEQDSKPFGFRLFVAPKDLDVLRAENPPLDGLVDFGWFSFVAKPLFLALRYVYDHWIHNYGWAIVILTLLINFAMFPLKLKSIRSAQEMQKIAPLVKSIQDRYKQYKFNDPRKQRMNQEVMKLYSEHHVNPLGGCLPMALQLPLLYGFYRLLDLSIELRHAPWFGWIKDLSAPDHLYILPSLMVITMFALQKMTPMATADPAQQRMMMIMPIFFGFMFFNFASGLVLYYLAANIVGIAQQMIINKMSRVPSPSGPGSPASRTVKQ